MNIQCDSLDVDGGADITGQTTVHGQFYVGGEIGIMGTSDSNKYLDVRLGSSTFHIRGTSGGDANHENLAQFTRNGAVTLYHNNSSKFATKSDGIDVTGEVQCDSLDVDGSANIQGSLTVQSDILMGDDDLLKLGDSDDLQISHDGSVSIIDGRFHPIEIRHQSEVHAKFNDDGAVELYYHNSKKFETVSNGVKNYWWTCKDGDGDLGTSGQVLSSTGTALNWVDADSGPQGVQGLKGNNWNHRFYWIYGFSRCSGS